MTQTESRLAAYDVEQEVGRGDLTIIYRAHRKSDGMLVTVKVIAPQFISDTYLVRRFLEAGERATHLDHPNIARVYDVGRREDVVFVIRDWIADESLAERLARGGPLTPNQTVAAVRQLAAALDYAHSQRLMHGDLNDRCVFIGEDGHVSVTDFGLTQALAGTDSFQSQQKTKPAHGAGTPEYLSSERAQGQSANRAADIYALGVLTYQMLAGRVPFKGEPTEVLYAQVHETPAAVYAVNPRVSAAVSDVVARALAKRPEMRFNTATEFARALGMAAEGTAPIRARAPAAAAAVRRPPLKFWQQPTFWAIIIAPIFGLLLAAVLWIVANWGERQFEFFVATPLPSPLPTLVVGAPPDTAATPPPVETPAVELVPTTAPGQTIPSTPTPSAALSPTSIATPAPVAIAEESPFSNLVVASGISDDHQAVSPGREFQAGDREVYLFFDYQGMPPGTNWGHVWVWGDQELDRAVATWPVEWGGDGRAWVFYTPEGGYQPGPYEVRLLVNDQVVASASFVVR